MKAKNSGTPTSKHGIYTLGLLAVILAILFWRSFLPDYVHFSNDGPLGQVNAAYAHLPEGFRGVWGDLNYIGGNGGSYTPNITAGLRCLLPPIAFAKYYPAIALFIVGLGAWSFFRQLKLTILAANLGALAAMLNSTFFSTACWGVATQEVAIGMIFFALALVSGCTPTTPILVRCSRLVLAGLCVGMNVMEAADIGALLSMLVALAVFAYAWVEDNSAPLQKAFRGITRVAVVAIFAGFIAIQTVLALVGTQIQGVAGTAQDSESKARQWDWATQWSLPKVETFGLLVPGLFGYKMDTPNNMQPSLQNAYNNGAYWGGVGRAPELDRYFDSGSKGDEPSGPNIYMRFTGGGNYCGIFVLLVAGWTIAQSLRRQGSIFPDNQKRMIQFWAVVMLFCLLFAWGRFAPFYAILYQLPYFSTIRNPAKFLIFFSWALVIVFAYGADALNRCYLDNGARKNTGVYKEIKSWWAKASNFDHKWFFVSIGLIIAGVLGWLIYAAQKPVLIRYLQNVGFPDADATHDNSAPAIAAFSIGQVEWFVVLFTLAVGLMLLVIVGLFKGPQRSKIGAILIGGFLIFDMGRANLPWVVHWDYKQKYEVGSLNPILEILHDKPYEHRVAGLQFPPPQGLELFDQLYRIEWVQHQFPYYNIQSLDIVQMPRMPEDMQAFKTALAPHNESESPLFAREWQLTNTRYLLGPAVFAEGMNQQLDPVQRRFHIIQRFSVQPKKGIDVPSGLTPDQYAYYLQPDKVTAVPDSNGPYALIEFAGALPRAKVYANWQVNTNDAATLKTLADLQFDPLQTVLVSTPGPGLPLIATNENTGTVEYKSYEPKRIILSAETTGPSVLLLNDKFDPEWKVTVDGKPADLLRCNFFMRGVYLPTAGQHIVEFNFNLPIGQFYNTLLAIMVGIVLCGFLFYASRKSEPAV